LRKFRSEEVAMHKIAGGTFGVAVLAAGIGIFMWSSKVTPNATIAKSAGASTAVLSVYSLTIEHGRDLPVENWPAF
jgi:hypothetical protein